MSTPKGSIFGNSMKRNVIRLFVYVWYNLYEKDNKSVNVIAKLNNNKLFISRVNKKIEHKFCI